MAIILEKTDSAYFPCFKNLFTNVVSSLTESREIALYLAPLGRFFKMIEETDFAEAKSLVPILVHAIGMAWAGSKYYQNSSKMIILMRMICNLLIQEARRFLDPTLIFQSDVDEALQRVQVSRGFCSTIRDPKFCSSRMTMILYFRCAKRIQAPI